MTINSSRKIVELRFWNGTFTIYEAGRARVDVDEKFYWEYVLSKWDIYYLHNWKYCIWKASWDFESCVVYWWWEQKLWSIFFSLFSSEDYFMNAAEVEVLNKKHKLWSITKHFLWPTSTP